MSNICKSAFYKLCLIWSSQFGEQDRIDGITPTFKDKKMWASKKFSDLPREKELVMCAGSYISFQLYQSACVQTAYNFQNVKLSCWNYWFFTFARSMHLSIFGGLYVTLQVLP